MFSYWAPPASAPLPRRTARSMLSFGTELFLAFWIASYSVGLPVGSPPPVRAATSTFLISLANILPRLASMTAFLCLVVAHLEWPGMGEPPLLPCVDVSLPYQLHEVPVHTQVAGQLGVEGRGQQAALPDRDNPTGGRTVGDAPHHLHARADPLDPRRPDEHGVQVRAVEGHGALERVDLAAERVPPDRHVDTAEGLLVGAPVEDLVGQHDH